jgi:hypothetical protein
LGLARKLCVNACRKLDRGGKTGGSVAAQRMTLGAQAKSGIQRDLAMEGALGSGKLWR